MATKNLVDQMTALEVARRSSDPNAFTILETMAMTNTMLQELPAQEANDGTVHTTLRRLSYPHGEHRLYNQGVGAKSSQTEPIQDVISMLEAHSDVDHDQAVHSGNPAALYNSEASAFLVGMGMDQAEELIYGSHQMDPAVINGLAIRYPKVDGEHCVDFKGAGNSLTSAYLMAPGPQSVGLIYPRGSKSVGVSREDGGLIWAKDPRDGAGKKEFRAHRDIFKAQYGLFVAHPDAVIRVCNIPLDLTKDQRIELLELILKYQKRLTKGIVNNVLFVNQDLIYQIERAGRESQYVVHPETDPWGRPVTAINGLRIREQDAILSTEEQVAAAA
jgi:hypothetical protein